MGRWQPIISTAKRKLPRNRRRGSHHQTHTLLVTVRRAGTQPRSASLVDDIVYSYVFRRFVQMNNHYGDLHDEATVPGFELPKSPDASYSNIYPGNEDLAKEPPLLPLQLQSTLLTTPVDADSEEPLPQPQNVTINHLYIENRDPPRTVVALGVTHRFCSKFVTVVLYKPVQRRGN